MRGKYRCRLPKVGLFSPRDDPQICIDPSREKRPEDEGSADAAVEASRADRIGDDGQPRARAERRGEDWQRSKIREALRSGNIRQ